MRVLTKEEHRLALINGMMVLSMTGLRMGLSGDQMKSVANILAQCNYGPTSTTTEPILNALVDAEVEKLLAPQEQSTKSDTKQETTKE